MERIIGLIFKIGFWITVLDLKYVSSFEEFWQEMQPVTQQLINSYITMCEKKGEVFDNIKMEDELNDCVSSNLERIMKPLIFNNGESPRKIALAIRDLKLSNTLSADQVDLIGRNIIEPTCQLLPAILICSKPYQYPLIKKCSANPDVEKIILDYMEIVIQASCKYNGNRIVDFLAANGMECVALFTEGRECFGNLTSQETALVEPGIICNLLGKAHECLVKKFEYCGGKVILRIMNLILDDIKTWITNQCARTKPKESTKKKSYGNSIIPAGIFSNIIFFVLFLQ